MGIRARIGISFERLIAHRNVALSVVASSALTSLIGASVVIAAVPLEDRCCEQRRNVMRKPMEDEAEFDSRPGARCWRSGGGQRPTCSIKFKCCSKSCAIPVAM